MPGGDRKDCQAPGDIVLVGQDTECSHGPGWELGLDRDTAEGDRAQHGVQVLVPVGDEVGLMTCPAVDPRPTAAAVQAQQAFQQRGAEFGHRRPDRQFHRGQALGTVSAERAGRQFCQPSYLGGELRLERADEPPLSPTGLVGVWPSSANAEIGLASQIASLTSTICWLTVTNS